MKKFTRLTSWCVPVLFTLTLFIFSAGCRKISIDKDDLRNFQQVNLVANSGVYAPVLTDVTLLNAWGLAWSPTRIAWVNSHDGHVSELYTEAGAIVRPPVHIPSPTDTIGGTPTGIVFSGGAGFTLPNNQGSLFLFAGEDGVLSGWNGAAGNNAFRIANNSATAHYTGLALATNNGHHLLYAANFKSGKIDVWDTSFMAVSLPFHDPFLPSGYAPFNIQAIGTWLFVAYAKVGPDGDEQAGAGLGFVDVFNTDGSFLTRFASRGFLNAPWGLTMTPTNFLDDQDMTNGDGKVKGDDHGGLKINPDGKHDNQPVILVGNFGDGRINVFTLQGQFLGQLQSQKHTIEIEKLWALSFAPVTATNTDQSRLYFTAGPNDENDGLFGYLIRN
jgi:uncharacterized protein (TIGR03118 family)